MEKLNQNRFVLYWTDENGVEHRQPVVPGLAVDFNPHPDKRWSYLQVGSMAYFDEELAFGLIAQKAKIEEAYLNAIKALNYLALIAAERLHDSEFKLWAGWFRTQHYRAWGEAEAANFAEMRRLDALQLNGRAPF